MNNKSFKEMGDLHRKLNPNDQRSDADIQKSFANLFGSVFGSETPPVQQQQEQKTFCSHCGTFQSVKGHRVARHQHHLGGNRIAVCQGSNQESKL